MRFVHFVGVVVAAVVVVAGPASAETVTIGQAGGSLACNSPIDLVQLANATPSYVVPAGTWKLTSWSTIAGGSSAGPLAGNLQLEVWRATATPLAWQLVGISPLVTTSASGLNTFQLSSPIVVRGGDHLGLRNLTLNYPCEAPGAGGIEGTINPTAPVPGETRVFGASSSALLNVRATLERVKHDDDDDGRRTTTTTASPGVPAATAVVVDPHFTG